MSHRSTYSWRIVLCLVILAVLPAGMAFGQSTIIVNTTFDNVDFGGAQQVGDLPGPDGQVSFREAIAAANNTPGGEDILFNIPTSDTGFNGSYFLIWNKGSQYILNDDNILIDGGAQTDFTGNTNASGPEIYIWGYVILPNNIGLIVNSDNNVIRDLGSFLWFRYGMELNGNNNTVTGCSLDPLSAAIHLTGANNMIGGTQPGDGNVLSSSGNGIWIRFASATGNIIQGNTITGNHSSGIDFEDGPSGNLIGGTEPGAGNVINSNGHTSSGSDPVGAQISIDDSDANIIQGNFLGVDASGTSDQSGSARSGIQLNGSLNTIGGPEPGAGNVISGMGFSGSGSREGILIDGGTGNTIQGNRIGTDITGTQAIPNEVGIRISVFLFSNVPTDNQIGGTGAGEGNTIAHNVEEGITVTGFGTADPIRMTFSGNSIFSNGDLGIDIGNNGVTPNDAGDGDTGENSLMNFPILVSAGDNGAQTTITGTIDTPNPQTVTIELFSSAAADPSGHGEGEIFQSSATPDAAGAFSAVLPGGLAGQLITATATDAAGSTSEFSAALVVDEGDGIPCSAIGDFRARCRPGGLIQARIRFFTADYDGQTVEFTVDGVDSYTSTIANQRATLSVSGYGAGDHVVDLTSPAGCLTPITVSCPASEAHDAAPESISGTLPQRTGLIGNYPNPFNPETEIHYELHRPAHVTLKVFNLLGEEVATLVSGPREAGFHGVHWNTAAAGTPVASGIYIYHLIAGDVQESGRMVLSR